LTAAGYLVGMKPIISMVAILVALGVMFTIFVLAYRYYKKSLPSDQPGDRGPG